MTRPNFLFFLSTAQIKRNYGSTKSNVCAPSFAVLKIHKVCALTLRIPEGVKWGSFAAVGARRLLLGAPPPTGASQPMPGRVLRRGRGWDPRRWLVWCPLPLRAVVVEWLNLFKIARIFLFLLNTVESQLAAAAAAWASEQVRHSFFAHPTRWLCSVRA